jgi:hypothetical protein
LPRLRAGAEFEVLLARRLAEIESPMAELEPRVEPRVYLRDDFAVTLWTYYRAVPPGDFAPAEYAEALERLHTGMRQATVKVPDFTELRDRGCSPWNQEVPKSRPSAPAATSLR